MSDSTPVEVREQWPRTAAFTWLVKQLRSRDWDIWERFQFAAMIGLGCALDEDRFRDAYRDNLNATLDEVEQAVRAIRSMPEQACASCPHCGGPIT